MNKAQYWKNFDLGKELDISGRFIYNGLQCFHYMEHFCHEGDIFEFFYNISVGIERLLKICIILIEHSDELNQKEFEKSLITHSHQELLKRIKEKRDVSFSKVHNDFIQLIEKFYKSHRYGRYSLEVLEIKENEKVQLHNFIEKYLKLKIDERPFRVTPNDSRIKRFIGKTIGGITEKLFQIIYSEAGRLNIFTYEIRYGSKASKIFTFKKYDFLDEDILQKELLIFLINNTKKFRRIKYIKSIEPLDFDPALTADYITCLSSNVKKLWIMDEIESLYGDLENIKERLSQIEIIDNSNVFFMDDEGEEE